GWRPPLDTKRPASARIRSGLFLAPRDPAEVARFGARNSTTREQQPAPVAIRSNAAACLAHKTTTRGNHHAVTRPRKHAWSPADRCCSEKRPGYPPALTR